MVRQDYMENLVESGPFFRSALDNLNEHELFVVANLLYSEIDGKDFDRVMDKLTDMVKNEDYDF